MPTVRTIRVANRYLRYPEGSCLFQMGHTKVLCTASINDEVPEHAKESARGWLSAEYSMLPRATTVRSSRGKMASGGRTKEIQRLIGRSLRAVMDLKSVPDLGILVDCDVIQADGGTRTAAINGGFIAMVEALRKWRKAGRLTAWPVQDFVTAISVGLIDGKPMLDLDYEKDVRADVDLNVVMTGKNHFIEIQGNAEHKPFSQKDLLRLLALAQQGIAQVRAVQKRILGDIQS